jgi:WD40 repeat protein
VTFDPKEEGNHVLAVCQDGWLLRSDDQGKALEHKQLLTEEIDGKKINLVSASFSPDGRALVLIWARDEGRKIVQFYSIVDGFCKSDDRLEIDHFSVYNTITWSADQNLIIIIPARWDDIGPCRAFYFTGTSYVSVDKPFDESPVLAVAFDPGANVIATASLKGSVQFWQWRGDAFEKLPDTPTSHSGFNFQDQRVRSMMFGKTKEELFVVTSGSGDGVQVQRINVPANGVESFGFATTKDQFLRLVAGPRTSARQLMATSLYGRVSINYSDAWGFASALAEPICFQGTTALSMFDLTGSKLMTLSGSIWLAPDTVQIWDVSMRIKGEAIGEFHADGNPALPWLAGLARAVSGIPRTWDSDDDAAVLSDVFKQTAPMAPDTSPYDKVWKHFLPEQTFGNRPRAEKARLRPTQVLRADKTTTDDDGDLELRHRAAQAVSQTNCAGTRTHKQGSPSANHNRPIFAVRKKCATVRNLRGAAHSQISATLQFLPFSIFGQSALSGCECCGKPIFPLMNRPHGARRVRRWRRDRGGAALVAALRPLMGDQPSVGCQAPLRWRSRLLRPSWRASSLSKS